MSRRDELIELCRREPEKIVDLLLALEAKVASLEVRLNRTSQNSDQPPSSDGLKKPPGHWKNRVQAVAVATEARGQRISGGMFNMVGGSKPFAPIC